MKQLLRQTLWLKDKIDENSIPFNKNFQFQYKPRCGVYERRFPFDNGFGQVLEQLHKLTILLEDQSGEIYKCCEYEQTFNVISKIMKYKGNYGDHLFYRFKRPSERIAWRLIMKNLGQKKELTQKLYCGYFVIR
jgi:hypothetical protein